MFGFTSLTSELCQQVGVFGSQRAKQAPPTDARQKDTKLISEYPENVGDCSFS